MRARVLLTGEELRRFGIKTTNVENTMLSASITRAGEIVAPPGSEMSVVAPVAGTVLAVPGVDFPAAGTFVPRERSFLRLIPLPPNHEIVRLEQELSNAASAHRAASDAAARVAALVADKLAPARERERADDDLTAILARLADLNAQMRRAKDTLSRDATQVLIKAPDDVAVRTINVAPGQWVAAGAMLAEIVRTDEFWVRVPVGTSEREAIRPHVVAAVSRLQDTVPEQAISAAPIAGPPARDSGDASLDVYYHVGNGRMWRLGEWVTVVLKMLGPGTPALQVPRSAVVRDKDGSAWVYERIDSLTFARRSIDVVGYGSRTAYLLGGPPAGAKIVIVGALELYRTEFGVTGPVRSP